MKTAALVLALLTATVQTVGWVECCCILICKHRNDPCSDCKEKEQAPASQADCCAKPHEEPSSEKRCAHVEPSSEVVAQAAALPSIALDLVLDLPLIPVLQAPTALRGAHAPSCEIRGSPPLHLLFSVLLI